MPQLYHHVIFGGPKDCNGVTSPDLYIHETPRFVVACFTTLGGAVGGAVGGGVGGAVGGGVGGGGRIALIAGASEGPTTGPRAHFEQLFSTIAGYPTAAYPSGEN